ncbi:putative metal chaperone YciC [Posidoniimonas polymericola]|uniref:Putative metal chaperone YciC n=2 Tax=Posidoniimonas polymericola TaxID=2528002 RepID=A0A5C5YLC2_9BACT|nr:putative metal chaperone YciC [Posidoniimonas polymericola]
MVGGFLGAGKTTAILEVAQRLIAQGLRVGLISNDQSVGLVDTTMFGSGGLPTEEISGGCFCCRFQSLVEAAQKLATEARPDAFLAEPVGSCTDLQATVSYPLKQLYGDDYSVAPLSVLVDPIRASRLLGLRPGKTFSPKVNYIYNKQLEEADVIVINKVDLLEASQLEELHAALQAAYPAAEVVRASARSGDGIDQWMAAIAADAPRARDAMKVDYETYAEGEALLGWLNLSATLRGDSFDGNQLLSSLIAAIGARLAADGIEVAHLKATLAPNQGNDLAVANLVLNGGQAERSHDLAAPLEEGELLVNLRAEGDPAALEAITREQIAAAARTANAAFDILHCEAFRPSPPTPTHRYA